MLSCIWAEDEQGLIGKDGRLPWHLPNDLKFFKEVTMDSTIVMGRKTFEGMGKRLLPGRHTIVLTRNAQYNGAGAELVTDPNQILEDALEEDVFVIGGAELFQWFAPHADWLYRTKIERVFDGDTYFPQIDWTLFSLKNEVVGEVDEKNPYPHRFQLFQNHSK